MALNPKSQRVVQRSRVEEAALGETGEQAEQRCSHQKMYNIMAASCADAAAWRYSGVTGTETQLESHQDTVQRQPCRLATGFALWVGRSGAALWRFAEPVLGEQQMGSKKGSARLKPWGGVFVKRCPGSLFFH